MAAFSSEILHITGIFGSALADFTAFQKTFLGLLPCGYGIVKKIVAEKIKTIPVLDIKPNMKESEGEFYFCFYANKCKSGRQIKI